MKQEKELYAGNWSYSRVLTFIRSALRKAWMKYPLRGEALKKARRDYKGPDKKRKAEYRCNICNNWFKSTDVQVDHISANGRLRDFKDLPEYVQFLLVRDVNELQVLCKNCHKKKTKEERTTKG